MSTGFIEIGASSVHCAALIAVGSNDPSDAAAPEADAPKTALARAKTHVPHHLPATDTTPASPHHLVVAVGAVGHD